MRKLWSAAAALLICSPLTAAAQPATTPGQVTTEVTLHSIGIEWPVTGDDDHDATCAVDYRVQGAPDWSQALPLLRVDYEGANTLAGSILFLEPSADYEVRLTLTDPDGGDTVETVNLTTRAVPALPVGGGEYHVVPGSGGGTGTESDPFMGIETAQAAAAAGDIFLLHGGNYGGRIEFDVPGEAGNYLVWKAAGDGEPIIEGIELSASHTWYEGLRVVVPAGEIGIHGTYLNPEDVVIVRNAISGCHYCVYPKEESSNWYIADNVIDGDELPDSGSLDGEGIELNHGNGHIVAHNSITHVADGVSYPGAGCDIYGNDIFDVSDDGIEPDYGPANVRVWGNRISNAANNGISFQPMSGAPWYVIRNQVVAGQNVIKIRDMDRAVILHNTFVGWQQVVSNDTDQLVGAWSNNNLWISVDGWYCWENGNPGPADWRTNLDYDGFDWAGHVYAMKWNDVRYETLEAFIADTGLEPHGVTIDAPTCLESFDVPAAPPASVPFQYMTLASGCNAIDAGIQLPSINDDYSGTAPDLGAYEVGADLPVYGPRDVSIVTTALPDAVIDTGYDFVLQAAGGTQPYTWAVTSGELPPGITLSDASLTGTPTELGQSSVTIEVEDGAQSTASRDFTLAVVEPGSSGTGGSGQGGTGGSSSTSGGASGDDDGCGCRVAGTPPRRALPPATLAALVCAVLALHRRRRRR
ncbi:MAG: right-handed parallel beta-helix repeat-containing protein [Deltaproteobacteria bacterium]|nr:right-handed parallel beta-helix repeat-containing protein [Deltaproteobacteria bacterium]